MPRLVNDLAIEDFANFIDAVGELIAAVLDMHGGIGVPHVAAVHISNARHGGASDAEALELPVKRGALHPHEFGGAGNVAAKTVDLRLSDIPARTPRAPRAAAAT